MAKFFTIIAVIAVSLALVTAGPAQLRQAKRSGALRVQKIRKSARQEVAPSPAPYPPAGVTPEIPFELPTETEKPFAPEPTPDQTYGPPEPTPDQTYGPPEPTPDQTYGPPEPTPDQTYGPPETDEPAITEPDQTYGPPETEATPDQTYGPPEADEPAITEPDQTYGPPETTNADEQPAIEEPAADSELVSQNLIQPRQKLVRSRSRARPAKLRARTLPVQSRGRIVEIVRSEPVLVYTLH